MNIISAKCCFLLLAAWSVSAFSQTAVAPANAGDPGAGTLANPYNIASLDNLYWMASQVNEHGNSFENTFFRQTDDIDAEDTENWFGGQGWTPIGCLTNTFAGTYDGNNKNIENLFIDRPDLSFAGLFGATDGSSLSNIRMVDADITGGFFVGALVGLAANTELSDIQTGGTVNGILCVGGLAGMFSGITIINSHSSGTVIGESAVGGLAGLITSSYKININQGGVKKPGDDASLTKPVISTFNGSHSDATVVTSNDAVGGLAGVVVRNANISIYTFKTGKPVFDITTHKSGNAVIVDKHGFISVAEDLPSGEAKGLDAPFFYFDDCHSVGTVSGTSLVGGLVGVAESASIDNSSAAGDVTGIYHVGGLTGVTIYTSIRNSHASGIVAGVYQVGGLAGMAVESSISRSHASGIVAGEEIVGGLAGMAVESSISRSHASGNVAAEEFVGGLAGMADSTSIKYSSATGDVIGQMVVGGLAGYVVDYSEIVQCYSTGDIIAIDNDSFSAGGLIGFAANSMVTNSYSTGSIYYIDRGIGFFIAGGFIGLTDSDISNCYSTGTIVQLTKLKAGHSTNGSLKRSERTGSKMIHQEKIKYVAGCDLDLSALFDGLDIASKSPPEAIGGFIGWLAEGGTIYNSFWDKQTSDIGEGVGSTTFPDKNHDGVTGKRTEQMKLIGTYNDTNMEGLDTPWSIAYPPRRNTVWHITNISTGYLSYPFLAGNSQMPAPGLTTEIPPVLNLSQQKFYDSVQDAIDESEPGDKIVFTGTFDILDASGTGITLSPGLSPGCATITGDFALSSTETLIVDINGHEPCNGHDRLTVEGNATLGNAALVVSLGFAPSLGDEFVLIESNNPIAGEFTDNNLTVIYGKRMYSFSVDYSDNAVTLKVVKIKTIPVATWSLLIFGLMAILFVFVREKL